MERGCGIGIVVLVALSFCPASWAQYSVPAQASETVGTSSARSRVSSEIVRPEGWEIGASLNFLTAETSLGGEDLRFTDLVILRLHGLAHVHDRVEVFVGADFLPKQPSYTDELEWQGALAGGRVAIGDHLAAWARGRIGPVLGRDGLWFGADAAGQGRIELAKSLFAQASLGWAHTQLFFEDGPGPTFWQGEVFSQVGIAIRDPGGHFGAWLDFDYFVPVVSSPDPAEGTTTLYDGLDPQPRVNLHLGGLIALSKEIDLFLEWSILDRGDLENPQTTLPILLGGFDQKQLLFGFMRRFGGDAE